MQNLKLETTGQSVTKVCNKCKVEKPVHEFHRDNTRRNGTDRHVSTCAKCNVLLTLSKQRAFKKAFGKGYRNDILHKVRPPVGTPCGICNNPMTHDRTASGMCFDHCHATETMRGWLCQKCNVGLGKLGDNIETLTAAIHYLQHAQTEIKS